MVVMLDMIVWFLYIYKYIYRKKYIKNITLKNIKLFFLFLLFYNNTKVTVKKNKIIFTNNNMMDRTIKQQIKEYKLQLLREKQEREQLLNAKTNWGALEQFIQKVNENPGLRVDVELRDGTVIHLQTVNKKQFDPYIGD